MRRRRGRRSGIALIDKRDLHRLPRGRLHRFGPLPAQMRNDTAFMDRIHAYLPGWDVPKMEPSLFTKHYGLVSDVLSECWTQLRIENRFNALQGRVQFGGALSGRDMTAVNRTVDGLLKLIHPDRDAEMPGDEIEWAVRLALECRRRVKEQQKRIGSAEFRNTHFSYQLGEAGVERFVVTPELQSEDAIASDPLPAPNLNKPRSRPLFPDPEPLSRLFVT